MTTREETLLFFDDFFKEIGLDYMIFASSLLGIVRDGKLLEHDAEIDICVLGKDLVGSAIDKIRNSGYFTGEYDCKEKQGETYLSKSGVQDGVAGWVAISPLWLKKGVAYINMTNNQCITMNPRNYKKKDWEMVEYIGRKFKCPPNPKKWLQEWYGDDWETPKKMHWTENENYKLHETLWH